jgi:TolB-like protein/Tfp pilus assembly protein PilF
VTEIRQAFEDDAHHPWLLETIPKRGYRLIPAPETVTPASVERPRRSFGGGVARWALAAAIPCIVVGLVVVLKQRQSGPPPARRIVIVLPFRNGSGDPKDDYLARGVSASIEEALWRMQAVSVSSALAENELPTLGAQAGAGNAVAVRGEVTRVADRVLVRAWLDDASTKERLWSASYSPPFADIVSIYDAVGTAIAAELNTSLDAAPPARPVDPAAYDEYLRGHYGEQRWMSGGCTDAEPHLEQATQIDPAFVAAWIELASCYVYPDRLRRPVVDLAPKAWAAIATALKLDERSGMAHALNAMAHYRLEYDWQCAADEFAAAYRLEPRNAQVCHEYAEFLYLSGHPDEGLGLSKRALELNPFAPGINIAYGFGLLVNRRYVEAAAQLRRALSIHGEATARFWLAETEARLGHFEVAAHEYAGWLDAVAQPVVDDDIGRAVNQCHQNVWAACQRADLALAELEIRQPGSAFKRPYGRYAGAYYQARRYALAGEVERAMDFLEQAHRERHHLMPFISIDPAFDGLRGNARFRELRRAVGPPTN